MSLGDGFARGDGFDGKSSKRSSPRVYGKLSRKTCHNPSPRLNPSPKDSVKKAKKGFDGSNLLCAGLILAAPDKFGGPESLMVKWASLVFARKVPLPEKKAAA